MCLAVFFFFCCCVWMGFFDCIVFYWKKRKKINDMSIGYCHVNRNAIRLQAMSFVSLLIKFGFPIAVLYGTINHKTDNHSHFGWWKTYGTHMVYTLSFNGSNIQWIFCRIHILLWLPTPYTQVLIIETAKWYREKHAIACSLSKFERQTSARG